MKQRRVYIIEDSLTIRALLEALIERDRRFLICGVATSAEAALVDMGAARPDIILLDLDLPGMHGLTFMEHMEADIRDPWCALKVVIVSTSAARDAPVCAAAFARGAAACFDIALASTRSSDLLMLLSLVGGIDPQAEAWRSPAVTLPKSARRVEARPDADRPSGPLTLI